MYFFFFLTEGARATPREWGRGRGKRETLKQAPPSTPCAGLDPELVVGLGARLDTGPDPGLDAGLESGLDLTTLRW